MSVLKDSEFIPREHSSNRLARPATGDVGGGRSFKRGWRVILFLALTLLPRSLSLPFVTAGPGVQLQAASFLLTRLAFKGFQRVLVQIPLRTFRPDSLPLAPMRHLSFPKPTPSAEVRSEDRRRARHGSRGDLSVTHAAHFENYRHLLQPL